MSDEKRCCFCAHADTNRRIGYQIRCKKKHGYVYGYITCKDYRDKNLERLGELFKEKENG